MFKFCITVARYDVRTVVLEIDALDQSLAEEEALKQAGDYEFPSVPHSEYEIYEIHQIESLPSC